MMALCLYITHWVVYPIVTLLHAVSSRGVQHILARSSRPRHSFVGNLAASSSSASAAAVATESQQPPTTAPLSSRGWWYLKRDRRWQRLHSSAESGAAGFKHRRPPAARRPRPVRLLTTDAYSYGRRVREEGGGGRQLDRLGSARGRPATRERPARCRRTEERKHVEACRRTTTTERRWQKLGSHDARRRRRIISPRQYCLSFAFYSPVAAHVRPSFL